ncbi:DE-cadherin-like isoform X2 [Temnothorax nylanderi]|uniref:DE-cadherin-like isoform X2 n=1 Tax=Temnothorax nylanderi TaxID=102681 RepID=UPI003A851D88
MGPLKKGTRPWPLVALPTSPPAFLASVLLLLLCGTLASATRLRHSRHLDVRSQFLGEGVLSLDENHNHKPVFSNCSNYAPVVKEEKPPGTVVIQVHAEDRDLPEEGGTITYSFVTGPEEKLKFKINNKTGLIRTTQMLDRDEPAREKEVYLTVLATDNGRPQLEDVCTFKVTIEDVNDNGPVFDEVVRLANYLSYQLVTNFLTARICKYESGCMWCE